MYFLCLQPKPHLYHSKKHKGNLNNNKKVSLNFTKNNNNNKIKNKEEEENYSHKYVSFTTKNILIKILNVLFKL